MGEQSPDGLEGCFSLTIGSRITRWAGVMVKFPVCCKLDEGYIGKLGAIVSTEYLLDAMFCKDFLQDWDSLGDIALRCRDSSDNGHHGVVVCDNWVLRSIKVELVSVKELPWAFWGKYSLEQLSWFLWAVLLTCWVWFNEMFDFWVDSRPINTVYESVLALADSYVSFMYCLCLLLPFQWRNDESFTPKDETIFNCEVFLWPWYGHRACGTLLISSGQPVMIILAREQRSGSSWMRAWNSVFLSGVMCTCWWWCLEVSLEPWVVHSERGHLQPASLCQVITWWCIIGLESEQHSLYTN